jgi:hypothetical protein
VHGVAEGVEDGSQLGGDLVVVDPYVGLGEYDVLGEGAVALDSHAGGADAHLAPAGAAVPADAADDVPLAGDPVADLTSRTPPPSSTTSP